MRISKTAEMNHEELFPNHKSMLYQSVPYVGIAKAFDFIHVTNEILESRCVKLPLEGQSTTSPETRFEMGLALQKEMFGEIIDKMYKESPENQIISRNICLPIASAITTPARGWTLRHGNC